MTQHLGVTPPALKGRIPQPAANAPLNAAQDAADLLCHKVTLFGSCSTRCQPEHSRPFPQSCFPAVCPQHVLVHGVIPPQRGGLSLSELPRVTVIQVKFQWSVFWGKSGEVQSEINDYLKDKDAFSSALLQQIHF